MNFLSAEVEVKVDDSQLSPQLARAKSAVTRTVDSIKSAFSKMATSFKAAFDTIVRYAKWGALAFTAALALMARAAMKQEDAIFLLAASLEAAGEYSKRAMQRFKEFATSIQQQTIYGDEDVLMLMQLQKSLGVTTDKLEEAAKMTIGLAAATGRDVQSMAMYVALAQQGEFTMLRRYIPALRSTSDETEQLRIVTEFAARGFKMAQAQAETTSGSLKQMKNALGDISEEIGTALLPGIKETAIAIKEWAQANQQAISYWAKIVVAYVTFGKNVFVDWLRFLKEDWVKGIHVALNISLEFFKAFGESLVIILKTAAIKASNAFIQAFGTSLGKWLVEVGKPEGILGKISMLSPVVAVGRIGIMKAGVGLAEAAAKPPTPTNMEAELSSVWRDAYSKISQISKQFNLDTSESHKKLVNQLSAIEAEYYPTLWQKMKTAAKDYYESWKDWLEDMRDRLTIVHAPKILDAEEIIAAYRSMGGQMGQITEKIYQVELAEIEKLKETYITSQMDKLTIDIWYAEQKRRLGDEMTRKELGSIKEMLDALDHEYEMLGKISEERERAESLARFESEVRKAITEEVLETAAGQARLNELMDQYNEKLNKLIEGRRGFSAFTAVIKDWGRDAMNVWARLGEITIGTIDNLSRTLAESFAGMKVNWEEFARSLLIDLSAMIMKAMMFKTLMLMFPGLAPAPIPVTVVPAAQEGGYVQHTGLAVIHKGETVTPANGGGIDIHIHNEGREKLQISATQQYMVSDQRIIDVTVRAMGSSGPYRHSLQQTANRS